MSWLSKLTGIAGKVGGIASKFVNAGGVVGKIAGGVSKAAGLIGSYATKIAPVVGAVATIGSALYKSGIADAITKGGATRLVKGITNFFSPSKGTAISYSPQVGQATGGSNTASFSDALKRS